MYSCAGFYPKGFSLIARRNGTRGISFDRDRRYRFAAQLGPQLLFNACKIAVEIDIQPAQGQRGNGVTPEGHASLYDGACQPSLPKPIGNFLQEARLNGGSVELLDYQP